MNTTATSYSSEHSWLNTSSRRNSVESILSIQGKETDYVRDTSDTEYSEGQVEFEPATDSEDEGPIDEQDSDTDTELISTEIVEVSVRDDGDLEFADSEETDSEDIDSEMDLHDYWKCALCSAVNNNPLYRYCEKCFKVRKNFFPPRPKRKSKCKPKQSDTQISVHRLTEHTDSGVDSAFNSQDLSQATSSHCESDNDKPSESKLVKRRAESLDRESKRPKIDTDSDSDRESNRKRKSKSVDTDFVAPLAKTVSDPTLTIDNSKSDNDMCIVCTTEPKSGVFVHGRIAHICCCYKCAVKVWAKSKRCPVCNCKVSNVLKAIVM